MGSMARLKLTAVRTYAKRILKVPPFGNVGDAFDLVSAIPVESLNALLDAMHKPNWREVMRRAGNYTISFSRAMHAW
jgi:hypothetical protein